MENDDHSWLLDGGIRTARRACDAGDANALTSAVARMVAFASRWGSADQQEQVRALRSCLDDMQVFEEDHGPGSALNLSHPSVQRLIASGSYTELEVSNARAAPDFTPKVWVGDPIRNR